ncbi:MAG: putative DNA binding domain-containing protein [Roseburia sp.]|nr:putative DNA binding domain-containing protein [Roseburia sp.]MCM1278913.1 putative DNA binding domain-containing protein [Robinsoniella sp.]
MDMQELKNLIYEGEKVDVECKKAQNSIPDSVYETYSSFANTKGGTIILGVDEDKTQIDSERRFIIRGINNPEKLREDFWNTINSQKVSANILVDDNVYVVEDEVSLLVIEVPRADFTIRPVYKGENPFKGTYKRNHEGDYHAKEYEIRAMIRDQSAAGSDSTILEGYTMDDIDSDTLERYRIMFNSWNPQHVWCELPDKEFLEMLGGYRRDRRRKVEGLTVAGLLMFGTGLAIRDEFDNIFMDYRNETNANDETRWVDRVTYDGTWENNLFNFFRKVTPKLTEDLKKPFVLKNLQRIEDTPVHKAIREAFVNMIIHSDYRMDAGVLKVIKINNGFSFSNPGNLKLPKEQIYKGGDSKARNPHMQTMLRMVGFGDNAGSGFPDILKIWSDNGWEVPELVEDTVLNQVTLVLKYKTEESGDTISSNIKMNEECIKEEQNERRLSEEEQNERRLSEDLSEVLTVSEYKKVEKIISYLEANKYITPQIAEELTGKSAPTVRRYLKMLVGTGYVKVDGSTSNIRYMI